ncbi:MAG: flavin reductase family protein [Lachnospiraceae bacterium]
MTDKIRLMDTVTQGVYIVGTKMKDTYNLMTAAWLMQVSFNPCRIALSIERTHYTAELIKNQGLFTISVLAKGQESVAKACGFQSGRTVDKSKHVAFEVTDKDLPIIKGCHAYLTCKISEDFDIGDHFLFVAEIQDGNIINSQPLKYSSETYF